MESKNYLEVKNNVVVNIIVWDGDTNIWTPPTDMTLLVQETTPAIVWVNTKFINESPNWVLQEVIGAGDIGFTWDGMRLTTNQSQPL